MQHKCSTWRNLQGDPVFSIYLTCSQHIVHGMTAEDSRPNPHGYKRQPTFQRDDMNRQEESKLYRLFIDQFRKYLNNEMFAMKELLKAIYFFKIFVLPRLNQDPRTTQKKKPRQYKNSSHTLSVLFSQATMPTIYSSSVSLRLLNFTHERLERRRRRRSDLRKKTLKIRKP